MSAHGFAIRQGKPSAGTAWQKGVQRYGSPLGSRDESPEIMPQNITGAPAPRQGRGGRRLRLMRDGPRKTFRPAPARGGFGVPAVAQFQQIVQTPLTARNGYIKLILFVFVLDI